MNRIKKRIKEDIENHLMRIHLAFTRRVTNHWITPIKTDPLSEDPEEEYSSIIVPSYLLEQTVVVMPLEKYRELIKVWRWSNPGIFDKILEEVLKNDQD